MAPRFSLHKRNGKFYAQLYSEELRRYLTARCTGTTNRNDAMLTVSEWMRDGWPTGRGRSMKPRPWNGEPGGAGTPPVCACSRRRRGSVPHRKPIYAGRKNLTSPPNPL